jgi:hypothetical protein
MANNNLSLDLKSRRDKDGMTYYVAKLKGNFLLDFKEGCTFLVFVADPGAEELQIAPMDNAKEMDD